MVDAFSNSGDPMHLQLRTDWHLDTGSYVLCCRALDEHHLACGLQSGECLIVDTKACKIAGSLNENWNCEQPFFLSKSPVTSIRICRSVTNQTNPTTINNNNNRLIAVAHASGIVKIFDSTPAQINGKLKLKFDDKRQTLCMDSCDDSRRICTGGSGGSLNIFDLQAQKFCGKLGPDGEMKARLFDVKFVPSSTGNIIFSGGWDDVVQVTLIIPKILS
ncbi:MAG: hypothetical protein MHMPM18_002723 [Marteilia pararefringens]